MKRIRLPALPAIVLLAGLLTGCVIMELPQVATGAVDLFDEGLDYIHVAPWGDDTNPGTKALPVETIQYALSLVPLQDTDVMELRIAAGDYTPGNGLIQSGEHGVMVRYRYHQPGSDSDWLSVVLSFGWDRLFETNDPAREGGTTRLLGSGTFTGGTGAVVLAFYDSGGVRKTAMDNLQNSYGTITTVFDAQFLGDFGLTVNGSLAVVP